MKNLQPMSIRDLLKLPPQDPIYIKLRGGKIDHTTPVKGLICDYDEYDHLLGIEILGYIELTVNGKKI